MPLWQHVHGRRRGCYDLFVDDEQTTVNPELVRLAREDARVRPTRPRDVRPAARAGRRPRGAHHVRSRVEVIERLDREALLPAITFIFSRAGCDAAVAAVPGARGCG